MLALNLPETALRITRRGGRLAVYDILRRRDVALTPEEWVRQRFVHFLVEHKGYPAARMANEVSLTLNGTRKRCDSVVYGRYAEPLMIAEYKAPGVAITQAVFDQVTRYNMRLRVRWLVVSNGLRHFCCRVDYEKGECHFVNDIPPFGSL